MATEQLTISMEGGAPYGFRLFGGEGQPLVVAKIRKRSKAWESGLVEGDALVSINDRSCSSISHADAMGMVDGTTDHHHHHHHHQQQQLHLKVLRKVGGGAAGQLHVTRGGGGRQRSLTPNAGVNAPAESFNPPPIRSSSVQWSSRVERQIHFQPGDRWQPTGSFVSGKEVQLHPDSLHESTEEAGVEETTRISKSTFNFSGQRGQGHREASKSTFPVSQSTFIAKHAPNFDPEPFPTRSPAVWKPSTNQGVLDTNLESKSGDGYGDAKENIYPAQVNRSINKTPVFQVEGRTKPAVWQPNVKPFSPSPLTEANRLERESVEEGKRFGIDRWKTETPEEKPFSFPPNLNKILAPNKADDFDVTSHEKKKVFVDSAFYDDPSHRYPTVDEQIRMARNVALSLTAPDNASARGHRMFMKRKEKSDKWVVDASKLDALVPHSDTEPEPYYNPTPWNPAAVQPTWKAASSSRGGFGGGGEVPVPPPLPTSRLFAPKLYPDPEDDLGERSKALSAEEFERLRLFSQKTTHTAISPQMCFSLAEDLRQSKGKGGRMFAKRRAKAEEWTVEGQQGPDPKMLQKISGGFGPGEETVPPAKVIAPVNGIATDGGAGGGGVNGGDFGLPVVNRLKEMVEIPKAKMTPWDAVAEFGNVDMAFDHLAGISFLRPSKTGTYADQVANSLQQATQKRPTPGFRSSPQPPPPSTAVAPSQKVPGFSKTGLPQNDRFTAPAVNNWSQNKSVSNPTTLEFSPSTFKGSGAAGYRPISFQPSLGTNSFSGERFTDL